MKPKNLFVHILAVILAFPFLGTSAQASVTIEVLDNFNYFVWGSQTRPQKINDNLDIVGEFADHAGTTNGFIRSHRAFNGHSGNSFMHALHEPNDTGFTEGRGINNSRWVCGDYLDSAGTFHGFFHFYCKTCPYTDYDVSGALGTSVLGINNVNDFVGDFTGADGITRAFSSIGGTVTQIDVPGATFSASYQLNASNTLVGYYIDSAGINHGFYQDSAGVLHAPIDPPGSTGTILFGINNQNWMVGRYEDSSGVTHGLLFEAPHTFVTFDYPASTTFTSLNGINNNGYICGRYLRDTTETGFVARAVRSSGSDAQIETNISVPTAPVRPKVPSSSERPSQVPAW
jgi:hypothetical protein